MKILIVIALVISGSYLILARPHIPWIDYDSYEMFGGYTDGDYDNSYTDDSLKSELEALAFDVDHDIYGTEGPVSDNDYSPFKASTEIDESDYKDFVSTWLTLLEKIVDANEEKQTETTVESNENSERDRSEYSKEDAEGSGEHSNGDSRVIFSAHINNDNLLKINLINSDDDANLKPDEYNHYDITAASSSSTQDSTGVSNEHNAEMEKVKNNELSVLLKPSSVLPSQSVELLSKLSLSSSNSELLTSEFQDNVQGFEKSHKHLENALNTLNYQSKKISDKFLSTAAGRTDYNGLQHKDIEMELSEMLANVDKVRAKISEMQLMEQRLNYHMLLNALLKEVYGQGGAL